MSLTDVDVYTIQFPVPGLDMIAPLFVFPVSPHLNGERYLYYKS